MTGNVGGITGRPIGVVFQLELGRTNSRRRYIIGPRDTRVEGSPHIGGGLVRSHAADEMRALQPLLKKNSQFRRYVFRSIEIGGDSLAMSTITTVN